MNLKKTTSFAIFSVLLLASCGQKKQETEQKPATYPTKVVNKQSADLETTFPVTIKGKEDIDIKPRIEGFIMDIYVDEGSVVRKGQSLFRIDSPSSQQALTSAQATVNMAQASLNTASTNVQRFRDLAQKGIVGEVQLRTYEDSYKTAEANLKQAQAVLTQAQATIGWTTVTSPVEGVIGTISFRQGSLVNSSSVLTTISNINDVFAYFSLNEKELITLLNNIPGDTQKEKIKNFREVSLTLADGTSYGEKGRIETISGVVDVATGSVNFRAIFPNRQGVLRSGSSGKITIPRTLDNIFVIPQKSTFQQQDKVLVYKVQGDSVVQNIISVLPTPDGKEYAVTDGLSDGDCILIDGIATLKNGMKISVK